MARAVATGQARQARQAGHPHPAFVTPMRPKHQKRALQLAGRLLRKSAASRVTVDEAEEMYGTAPEMMARVYRNSRARLRIDPGRCVHATNVGRRCSRAVASSLTRRCASHGRAVAEFLGTALGMMLQRGLGSVAGQVARLVERQLTPTLIEVEPGPTARPLGADPLPLGSPGPFLYDIVDRRFGAPAAERLVPGWPGGVTWGRYRVGTRDGRIEIWDGDRIIGGLADRLGWLIGEPSHQPQFYERDGTLIIFLRHELYVTEVVVSPAGPAGPA